MMPKLSGFQLLSYMRENKLTCHIPVILLSARGGEDAQLEGLKMVLLIFINFIFFIFFNYYNREQMITC